MDVNHSDIKNAIAIIQFIRSEAQKSKDFGMDMPLTEFIDYMQLLTPQSYGSRLESKIIQELHYERVNSKKDSGDCKDRFGDYYEIKISIINASNGYINLVQIRPWQDIDGYIVVSIDVRVEPYDIKVFKLSKEEMSEELKLCNASSAHGTKNVTKNNIKVELRFGIKVDKNDFNFIRWNKKYLTKFKFSD